MSEAIKCPFCKSKSVVVCQVDNGSGFSFKYKLLNDESNYNIASMITMDNYDPRSQSGIYWGIEIYHCKKCGAEWGRGVDVYVADLGARAEQLQKYNEKLEAENDELKDSDAMLRITAIFKALGEMGYIAQVAELKEKAEKAKAVVERLVEEIDKHKGGYPVAGDDWNGMGNLHAIADEWKEMQK